jgi:hypothetical protein
MTIATTNNRVVRRTSERHGGTCGRWRRCGDSSGVLASATDVGLCCVFRSGIVLCCVIFRCVFVCFVSQSQLIRNRSRSVIVVPSWPARRRCRRPMPPLRQPHSLRNAMQGLFQKTNFKENRQEIESNMRHTNTSNNNIEQRATWRRCAVGL